MFLNALNSIDLEG